MRWYRWVLLGTIVLILLGLVLAEPVSDVKANSYVTDYANLFSSEEKLSLEGFVHGININSTVEIAVITVNDLDGLDIETYSIELAEKLKVGKKDVDNGLIIIIAPNERKFRIEVGYGLEGVITNAMAGRIGRDVMVPQFEQAKYYEGVHESLKVIFSLIQKDPDVVSQYSGSSNYKGARIDYFILLFVILLVITSAIRKSETKGKKWGMRGIYVLPIVLGVFVGAALLAGFAILSIIFFAWEECFSASKVS